MTASHQAPPTISVLLPVHNGERYLREALDSILAQTFQDFEVIAIDDGSTDGTLAILRHYAAREGRMRVVSRERQGLVATLNEGIELSRGKWIARMDADDIAMPERFVMQLAQLESSRADFCGGAIECFGEWRGVWRYPTTHRACEAHMLFDVPFAHPTVVGRTSAFKAIRYADGFPYTEDYDLWQRAWATGYRFTNVAEVVLRYRVHGQQVSSRHQKNQRHGADRVRRRHWQALFPEMDGEEIERIVVAMGTGHGRTASLMPVLRQLLRRYSGEAHEILFADCFRVFCRLAGRDPRAAMNWLTLVEGVPARVSRRDLGRAAALLLLSLLRTSPGGTLFQQLRRLRGRVASS